MTLQIGDKAKKAILHKKRSLLNTFLIAACIIVGILLALEGLSRLYQIKPNQPIRSVGNFHAQFETKWFKLKDYVIQNGGVDVLLVGNSMVNTGLDPEVFAQEYEARTGIKLRVFNYGIEGLDLATNVDWITLLANEYHPKAILVFLDMRDFNWDVEPEVRYQEAVWFQYKLGNIESLEGWIYDQSALMQYFLPFRNWSRADFPDFMLKDLYRYSQTTDAGYEPDRAYGKDIDVTTDPNDPELRPLFELYRNFSPGQDRLADLRGLLELRAKDIQVFVTEMPLYKTFYDPFGGEEVHQTFLSTIEELTVQNQGVYLNPVDASLIPNVGRADNHHLNFEGAPLYSRLLAEMLAEMCLHQGQCLGDEVVK